MPRAPRIQFEKAVYHVMARCDRFEPIVQNDNDRNLFVETFGEVCARTGREVFARVLLDNHYHFGMSPDELKQPIRGDLRRVAIAWALAQSTSIPQGGKSQSNSLYARPRM